MTNRLLRAWLARLTVVAAVLALPAIGAGAAQAAIAGGPHEVTTNRPDLVSASILSSVANAVDFCFDKTLQSTTGGGGFFVGGYRAANSLNSTSYELETQLAPPAGLPADSCIRANYATAPDLPEYTIGTVAPGVVTTNGGVPSVDTNNFPDSTPLTGSNTHNGTSGFTTGPDLVTVMPDSTTNTIAYFFDQELSGAKVPAPGFYFVDAAGIVCQPTTAPVAGGKQGDNFVTFSYAGDTCGESVSNAVRAGDFRGSVTSFNDPIAANDDNSQPIVGSGATSRPDLTDVKMEADQSALDFTFDKTVTPVNISAFLADLSNGTEIPANNATVIAVSTTSTTIRATFPNFGTYDEYVIGGSVDNNCAVRITALLSSCNIPAAAPLDAPFGNIGAFATGYTTGPDVLGAVGNTTTNVVQVALDQRAFHIGGGITLLDGTGNPIVTALGTSIQLPSQAAGPQTIDVTYSSGQVGLAQNLFVPFGALTTNSGTGPAGFCAGFPPPAGGCVDQPTVNQIVALTKTSTILKAEAHAKKANMARDRRLLRARERAAKRALQRWLRKHHRSARL